MRNKLIVLCMFAAALTLLACGSSDSTPTVDPGKEGGACKAGLCDDGLVCVSNVCKKDTTEDGDTTPTDCSGACTGTPATKCINSDTDLCVCSEKAWTPVTCSAFCAKSNKTSKGCGMDSTKNMDYCLCEAATEDGDPDTDTNVEDGDKETDVPVDGDPDTADGDVEQPPVYAKACELQVTETDYLNKGAAACPNGTVCMGMYLNGQGQGQTAEDAIECQGDSECWTQLGGLGVCVGGFCGMSFCGIEAACSNDTACTLVGENACCRKQGTATTGQCMPYDWCPPVGTGEPGDPCAFTDDLNKDAGNCIDSTMCLGMLYNKSGSTATCSTKADCAKYGLTSDLVGCSKSGYCGISFCSADAGSECTATAGTNPQPGSSATCEAIAKMNSDRYGKACCQVVSGKKLCIPDSLCQQEGSAGAGQACKEPGENINPTKDFCTADLYCLGLSPSTPVSCTTKADCSGLPTELVDCVSGTCKFSYCTKLECTGNSDCSTADYGTGACCNTSLFSDGTGVCGGSYICQTGK